MIYLLCIIAAAGLILLVYMLQEAFQNRVLFQTLTFPEYPENMEPLNIFFISDIHRRTIHSSIIERVQTKADIVVIGGDLLEKGVPLTRIKENLALLKKIAPTYFIWGNNDYEVDQASFTRLLHEEGIKALKNETEFVSLGMGKEFFLLGIDDMNQRQARLDEALRQCTTPGFRILASHNPAIIHKMKDYPGHNISLILSGHTHGGQIHIFGYSPYKRGTLKTNGPVAQLISNGYGTTAVPLRLGARPETHLLTISHGNEFKVYRN
ncbi:metallophosphoesterase [Falsibacillus pallidus]|uniref:metallophosphoesterase n=1 Tax=Falsibacillus pallidus TaxID=493781 RepID=UPI003D9986CB